MNPFEHTRSIGFGLSNLCNLAQMHARCPLHAQMLSPYTMREPATLPASIVHKSLIALASYGWHGLVEFHQYNEPLMDPRLFLFLRWVAEILPDSRVELVTNGFQLTPQLAEELREYGVTRLHVSLYGTEDERRDRAQWLMEEINKRLPVALGWHALDDRTTWYGREPVSCTEPCGAPLTNLVVNCHGQMGLCCFDWRESVTFGDLYQFSLSDLVSSKWANQVYEDLQQGKRELAICQRCGQARGA